MTKLSGVTWDHQRGYAPLFASAETYRLQTDISVKWTARSLKDFGDAPLADLAERYDLLILDHPHIGEACSCGALIDLRTLLGREVVDALSEESVGPSFASYAYHGGQWALPVDAAVQCACYREGLLRDELPTSWSEAIKVGHRLRKEGRWLAIPLCPTDAMCCFLTLLAQLGEGPREDRQALASVETQRRALRILLRIVEVAHPVSLDSNPIRIYEMMRQDTGIAYCPLAFCYAFYTGNEVPVPLRFVPPPGGGRALIGGAGIGLSSHCRAPEAAARYALWLSQSAYQRTEYTFRGGQPANLLAWKDDEVNRRFRGFFRDLLPVVCEGFVRPRSVSWPRFQEQIGLCVHAFLAGQINEETCIRDIAVHNEERNAATREPTKRESD